MVAISTAVAGTAALVRRATDRQQPVAKLSQALATKRKVPLSNDATQRVANARPMLF